MKLEEKTENIVTDAFRILIHNEKEIANAISKKKSNNDDEEEVEDADTSQARKSHGHVVAKIDEVSDIAQGGEVEKFYIILTKFLF